MVKRILVSSIAGAIVLFLWGCAAWMFLPTYTNFEDILDEEAVVRTLNESLPERGVYYFPKHPERGQSISEWNQKVSIGPTGLILFNPQGHGAVGFRKFAAAFLTQWMAAALAAYLLSLTLAGKPGFRLRWLFVLLIGCIVSLVAYLPDLIWYGFPAGYTVNLMRDMIMGWALAGLVLAYLIKTPSEEKKQIQLENKIKSEIRNKLTT